MKRLWENIFLIWRCDDLRCFHQSIKAGCLWAHCWVDHSICDNIPLPKIIIMKKPTEQNHLRFADMGVECTRIEFLESNKMEHLYWIWYLCEDHETNDPKTLDIHLHLLFFDNHRWRFVYLLVLMPMTCRWLMFSSRHLPTYDGFFLCNISSAYRVGIFRG
jgi:hypothetical protein